MNSDFSRVITLLRKERNISQKKAAMDLNISQGLLSHYEKGKRECGLDFLVRAADYYNVSCDYLLGRSPEPQGKTITFDDIPDDDSSKKEQLGAGGVMVAFNKKLIVNSVNVLFSLLQKCKSSTMIKEISSYLMIAVYQMFRIVYSANSKNDQNFFTVPKSVSQGTANAAMSVSQAAASACASGIKYNGGDTVENSEELAITTDTLAREYPKHYSSMVNLIKNSEAKIQMLTNAEK
ncbi:MAG: helix-turn-helix transcriptional regulator [Oscillospiraceae bacterium]